MSAKIEKLKAAIAMVRELGGEVTLPKRVAVEMMKEGGFEKWPDLGAAVGAELEYDTACGEFRFR